MLTVQFLSLPDDLWLRQSPGRDGVYEGVRFNEVEEVCDCLRCPRSCRAGVSNRSRVRRHFF